MEKAIPYVQLFLKSLEEIANSAFTATSTELLTIYKQM